MVVLSIAAAVALVVGFLNILNGDNAPQKVDVGGQARESTATTAGTLPAGVSPAVWDKAFPDGKTAVTEFAAQYLAMRSPQVGEGDTDGRYVVRAEAGRAPPTVVQTMREDRGWVVTHARSDNLRLLSPATGSTAVSPLNVSGEATAADGTVQIQVRQDGTEAGITIGAAEYPVGNNGSLAPLDVSMIYRRPATPAGALLLYTLAEDRSVAEATVVRVVFKVTQPGEIPGRYVAATADGRVVTTSTSDGRELSATQVGTAARPNVSSITTSEDGTWFAARAKDACDSEIVSSRGAHEPGLAPDVSPDGRRLAFIRPAPDDGCRHREVMIRNLATGKEAKFTPPSTGLTEVAWAPDSHHLALLGKDANGAVLLMSDTDNLRATPSPVGRGWTMPTDNVPTRLLWVRDSLAIESYCCVKDYWEPNGVAVALLGELVLNPGRVLSLGIDHTGTHVLYVDIGDGLWRWNATTPDSQPVKLRDGVVDADW